MTTIDSPSPSDIQYQLNTNIRFSIWHTFKHRIPYIFFTCIIDIAFPLIIYFSLQPHIKPVYALLIAGIPPFLMIILKATCSQTFDALGFLIVLSFIISSTVALITRNPIVILLEKSLITGIFSFLFGVTLIPFDNCHFQYRLYPFAYYCYQDLIPLTLIELGLSANVIVDEHSPLVETLTLKQEINLVYQWMYKICSSFRRSCYTITSIWCFGLFLEFLSRLILILIHMPVNKIVIYGNIILTLLTISCILLTIICVIKERRKSIYFIQQWKIERFNSTQI